jgi:hypothetical protein
MMLELAREIQEMIQGEAQGAISSGWADLTIDEGEIGPSIHLEPVKLASAPLELYFDSTELVICSPGRKGMTCEFFSDSEETIKAQVRALAAAVVAGTYVERLRDGTSELLAEWPGPEGKEEAIREALISSGAGGGELTTIVYEPY